MSLRSSFDGREMGHIARFGLTSVIIVGMACPLPASAANVFIKLADSTTPVPGGPGNFLSFYTDPGRAFPTPPAIDGSNVVFGGESAAGQFGLYLWQNGTLSVIADH